MTPPPGRPGSGRGACLITTLIVLISAVTFLVPLVVLLTSRP